MLCQEDIVVNIVLVEALVVTSSGELSVATVNSAKHILIRPQI